MYFDFLSDVIGKAELGIRKHGYTPPQFMHTIMRKIFHIVGALRMRIRWLCFLILIAPTIVFGVNRYTRICAPMPLLVAWSFIFMIIFSESRPRVVAESGVNF